MAISTAQMVRKKVEKMSPGTVFDYSRFGMANSEGLSLAKSLSRLAKQGTIVRLAKGKYYKPRITNFGPLRPSEAVLIKALTTRGNKRIGYLTGLSVYNRLGLTSQVPNTLTIATKKTLPPKTVEGYKVKYVKREVDIREQEIPLLQILDALQDIKHIPDASPDEVLKVLIPKIKTLSQEQLKQLVKLSLHYNAATRALLGAILENSIPDPEIGKLKNSLNKLSVYKIGISKTILPNQSTWNIK